MSVQFNSNQQNETLADSGVDTVTLQTSSKVSSY